MALGRLQAKDLFLFGTPIYPQTDNVSNSYDHVRAYDNRGVISLQGVRAVRNMVSVEYMVGTTTPITVNASLGLRLDSSEYLEGFVPNRFTLTHEAGQAARIRVDAVGYPRMKAITSDRAFNFSIPIDPYLIDGVISNNGGLVATSVVWEISCDLGTAKDENAFDSIILVTNPFVKVTESGAGSLTVTPECKIPRLEVVSTSNSGSNQALDTYSASFEGPAVFSQMGYTSLTN